MHNTHGVTCKIQYRPISFTSHLFTFFYFLSNIYLLFKTDTLFCGECAAGKLIMLVRLIPY